ncbi:zinc knuckle CX2CX4HX4C containing protein [Tanacetum coccineum]
MSLTMLFQNLMPLLLLSTTIAPGMFKLNLEPLALKVLKNKDAHLEYIKHSRVVQIVLWYLDSGCSKHMTENRSQLNNFVNKFLGTVKFGNDQIAKRMGVDLLTGSRGTNLYTLSIGDMMKSSLICLLSKASKTKSWLWNRCLSHLNFGPINQLAKQGLVRGTMAGVDIDTLTMEQYLALLRENQAPGVVKQEIRGNVNFKIKSQFMRELREDTFSENKDEDAHDHIDRVLSIVGLFNIPGVSKDAVMLRVFPFTLTGAVKRWVDRLAPGTINTWDLLKKAFIQRYCPPSMTAKQLEDIHNFKQEGDESLYQAWERKIGSSSSNDGLAALVNKLDNLGRDMKKLKESVHAIQVRYGDFRRTTPFNENNGGKFRVGPHGYYTKIDNRPPYGKKRQSLEELLAKHQEESAQRSTEMEVWIKKLQKNAEINTRNQSISLKNLETQIEQLTKEIHSDKTLNSSSKQIKTVTVDHETSGLNKLHRVSFISEPESDTPEVLQHQLPPKELNPGSFTLPCRIGKFNFYAMADLGASEGLIK